MDRLVYGMAKINFQQNCCEDVLTENHTQNISCINPPPPPPTVLSFFNTFAQQKFCSSTMSTILAKEEEEPTKVSHLPGASSNTSTETEVELNVAAGEGAEPDAIDTADDYPSCSNNSSAIGRLSQRRNMPSRSCKENSSKTKRRSIAKPQRYACKTSEFTTLRSAEIKKIYLNKTLTKFRPSNLETIFEEEPQKLKREVVATGSADDNQLCFIGIRKIKRSLSCSDGFNMNKNIIKQRRAKIKRTFGRRFALKKISLQDFVEHLNKSIEDDNTCTQTNETAIEEMDADGNAAAMGSVSTTILLDNNFKTVSMQSLQLAEEVDIINEDDKEAVGSEESTLIKSNSFSGVTTTNTVVTDGGGGMGDGDFI